MRCFNCFDRCALFLLNFTLVIFSHCTDCCGAIPASLETHITNGTYTIADYSGLRALYESQGYNATIWGAYIHFLYGSNTQLATAIWPDSKIKADGRLMSVYPHPDQYYFGTHLIVDIHGPSSSPSYAEIVHTNVINLKKNTLIPPSNMYFFMSTAQTVNSANGHYLRNGKLFRLNVYAQLGNLDAKQDDDRYIIAANNNIRKFDDLLSFSMSSADSDFSGTDGEVRTPLGNVSFYTGSLHYYAGWNAAHPSHFGGVRHVTNNDTVRGTNYGEVGNKRHQLLFPNFEIYHHFDGWFYNTGTDFKYSTLGPYPTDKVPTPNISRSYVYDNRRSPLIHHPRKVAGLSSLGRNILVMVGTGSNSGTIALAKSITVTGRFWPAFATDYIKFATSLLNSEKGCYSLKLLTSSSGGTEYIYFLSLDKGIVKLSKESSAETISATNRPLFAANQTSAAGYDKINPDSKFIDFTFLSDKSIVVLAETKSATKSFLSLITFFSNGKSEYQEAANKFAVDKSNVIAEISATKGFQIVENDNKLFVINVKSNGNLDLYVIPYKITDSGVIRCYTKVICDNIATNVHKLVSMGITAGELWITYMSSDVKYMAININVNTLISSLPIQ